MADDYASAIRGGTMAAGRLHRQLALRERIEGQGGGNIDVFASMVTLELPLLLRPLRNLLGAYLREPAARGACHHAPAAEYPAFHRCA